MLLSLPSSLKAMKKCPSVRIKRKTYKFVFNFCLVSGKVTQLKRQSHWQSHWQLHWQHQMVLKFRCCDQGNAFNPAHEVVQTQYIFIFVIIIFVLFNYSCLHLPPTTPPYPSQTHLPPLLPPSPLVLSMCPVQQFLKTPPPTVPSPLSSGYCQTVLNFDVSGYILFAFFFC